jgi:hypothetical protein
MKPTKTQSINVLSLFDGISAKIALDKLELKQPLQFRNR